MFIIVYCTNTRTLSKQHLLIWRKEPLTRGRIQIGDPALLEIKYIATASFHLKSDMITDELPPREYWPTGPVMMISGRQRNVSVECHCI